VPADRSHEAEERSPGLVLDDRRDVRVCTQPPGQLAFVEQNRAHVDRTRARQLDEEMIGGDFRAGPEIT
jgi:hypothetical protein